MEQVRLFVEFSLHRMFLERVLQVVPFTQQPVDVLRLTKLDELRQKLKLIQVYHFENLTANLLVAGQNSTDCIFDQAAPGLHL